MERQNERNCTEVFFPGEHLPFHELREKVYNKYLNNFRSIPKYPDPVEFCVANLRHDTCYSNFQGIMKEGGFIKPGSEATSDRRLLWWSLAISEDDIKGAERRYLEYYNTEAVKRFLHKFTTSPAFRKSSRMGNFRFTFSLRDLLARYKEQFCMGEEPQMRIFETVLYKQEVMYSIVVHGPDGQHDFGTYPPLQEPRAGAVCSYQNGNILWRAEGMSETHVFGLSRYMRVYRIPKKRRRNYAWGHVAVAFHVPQGRIFQFDQESLHSHLSLCQGAKPRLSKEHFIRCEFESIPQQQEC